jgi:hypothetical protein
VIEPDVEQFLARLDRSLRGLRRRERERALREARDHVLCGATEQESLGLRRPEAVRSAIEAFGAVESVAAGYARPLRSRTELWPAVAVVALLVLAIAPTGGRIGQILIPTSHAAVSECAARWNARPAAAGFPLAWVSSPRPSCEVVLHGTTHALVLRQAEPGSRWRTIVPAGRASWLVTSLPAELRAHAYAVDSGGRIGRRLAG